MCVCVAKAWLSYKYYLYVYVMFRIVACKCFIYLFIFFFCNFFLLLYYSSAVRFALEVTFLSAVFKLLINLFLFC